jgi:hypothetical protein
VTGFDDDLEARELADRLARADFSGDSRVRKSLRARLLAAPSRRLPAVAAWALAAILTAIVPFALPSKSHAPRFARGENGLPVLPGRLPASGVAEEPVFVSRRTSLDEIFVKIKR